ncbi:hypothetical protein [Humidesulfovibrio idahonensis]
MKPLLAIPCHGLPPEGAQHALDRTLALLDGLGLAVHVFHAPGQALRLPPGVRGHQLSTGPETCATLPAGWLAAAEILRGLKAEAVLFVTPRNPNLTAGRVAEALERLAGAGTGNGADVLLSVAPCRDHPCQWQEYLDIVACQAFSPVDPDAAQACAAVAAAAGLTGRAHASAPFRMPSSAPWPQNADGDEGGVFEWLGSASRLVRLAPGAQAQPLSAHGRVFLRREDGIFVRQVVFCEQDLAAMPLLRPVGEGPACFVRQGADWLMGAGTKLLAATRNQLFPLPDKRQPQNLERSLILRNQTLEAGSFTAAGGVFRKAGTVPPQTGSPVFVLNALAPAQLPQADIFIPFTSACGGWELDYRIMAAVNCATGKRIHGRQSFPDVLELEGSLLGFSAAGLRDPLSALNAVTGMEFVVLNDQERLTEDACGAPGVSGRGGPGRDWTGLGWAESDRAESDWTESAWAESDGPHGSETSTGQSTAPQPGAALPADLLSALDEARSELALARAALGGEPSGAARPHGEKALAALAELRRLHAALTFEFALVDRQLREVDLGVELLPLRIHSIHWAKLLSLLPADFERVELPRLLEDLLELWEKLSQDAQPGMSALPSTHAALAGMRQHARAAALPGGWSAGLPLLLARRDMFDEAEALLDEQYRQSPWLQDEYARIAVECFRPRLRFDEYLRWLERDALAGRMSPRWLYHYCEALAVCKREKEALALTAAAYAKQPSLRSHYAIIAVWRFALRDFDPARALPIFELDQREGRLGEEYAPLYAAALAYTGELEHANDIVERAYVKNVAVANGYAMIGWHHHYLLRHDARAALSLFDRDAGLGRLDASWMNYQAMLHAFLGDMETAERMVLETYDRSPLHCNCLAQLGTTHWLAHRDTDRALELFRRDDELGRLRSTDMLLVRRAFQALAAQGKEEGRGEPVAQLTLDLCVARLGMLGYRQEDVQALMPASFRGQCPEPAAATRGRNA